MISARPPAALALVFASIVAWSAVGVWVVLRVVTMEGAAEYKEESASGVVVALVGVADMGAEEGKDTLVTEVAADVVAEEGKDALVAKVAADVGAEEETNALLFEVAADMFAEEEINEVAADVGAEEETDALATEVAADVVAEEKRGVKCEV